jgi:3-phenylpropionate/cinnamic acid dioxygenase small subunit
MTLSIQDKVSELLFEEADYLDQKQWSKWLNLYTEDCIYWVPAWINESVYTTNPDEELNLLYLKGKQNLIDRVFRIETGDSFASVPMDRTTHLISNIRILSRENNSIYLKSNWIVHSYGIREGQTRGGFYEFTLIQTDLGLKIAQKKIILIDDKLIGPVDIFHL